jgi:CheY-like chemotaxis protein
MATILCIDDDPSVREIYKALFESKGYTVLTAPDGPTGISLSSKHRVDAVVLDFNMPNMNGDQVADVLAKERPKVPVVIWSGSPDQIPECLKWFASALPHKGDGPNALLSAIDKIIGRIRSGRKPTVGTSGTAAGRYSDPKNSRVKRSNSQR